MLISLYVGQGEVEGFVVPGENGTDAEFLPHAFWDCDADVHLFAYACFSAECIRRVEIFGRLAGAIGFSGLVMFGLQNERYWPTLLTDIQRAMRSKVADARLFALIQQNFSRRILSRRKRPDYLTQLCLMSQSKALTLVKGVEASL